MSVKSFNKTIISFIILTGFLFLVPGANASDNSCIDCHKTVTPFTVQQMQFNQIRIEHLEKGITCSLDCHEDRIMNLSTSNYQQWSESVHALKGVTCDACHGGDPKQPTKEKAHANITNTTDPESPVYYTNVPKTCGKCHPDEFANFQTSMHYQKLESFKLAPTCTTCHAPHTFTVLNPEDFITICGNCHSVYKKIAPYDIPLKAEDLLARVNKLKFNIDMTRQDIFWAKQNGTDVTQAERYANNSLTELQNLAPMWHEFNLTHFEDELDAANKDIMKADALVKPTGTPTSTPVPRIPDFMGLTVIITLLAMWYLIRKK